ncbi:MAG: hypothetical protein WBH14_04460 [Albidovulum sp.]
MLFLSLIFLVSSAACLAAISTIAPTDLLLLALPSAVGSLLLLLNKLWKRRGGTPRWIVIDGSNVMHWKNDTPSIEPVREVIAELTGMGFTPGVVFDANAGYKLSGRYLNARALARLLVLPIDRVHVVPKGEPADPFILRAASGLGAKIVTNDRFRDWAELHPEIRSPGFLIQGRYEAGRLVLATETRELGT